MAEAPYATKAHILSGQGAARFGQRWNPPGILAIYMCLSPDLAMREWQAQRRKAGMTSHRHLPLTQITISVKLQKVLDFRKAAVKTAFGRPLAPFIAERHTPQIEGDPEMRAQALGRIAHSRNLEAIIVPSAQNHSMFNLVAYKDTFTTGSKLEIHGHEYLLP
ncbi:MAG TPA: RES family NAD+ phosphorylase [Phycisphaerae bacterium]